MQRPGQRGGAGREHENPGLVQVDELADRDRVGRVGHDGGEPGTEFGLQVRQPFPVPGQARDGCAGLRQGDGNAAAEAPASAGH
jgi:hypothetical protein